MRHDQNKRSRTSKKEVPVRPGSPLYLALIRIAENVAKSLDAKSKREQGNSSFERRDNL
jgi:hypothetical protein